MKIAVSILFLILCYNVVSAQTSYELVSEGQKKLSIGEYEKALAFFDQAVEVDSEYSDAYVRRAFVHSVMENYDTAIKDYNKALELSPGQVHILIDRGSAYNKLNQFEKALSDFDRAITLDPKNARAYNNRGWAKKGLGDKEGACKDWKKSKKLGNGEAKIILINNQC
jgi:tetratricopeptide (TPR) repeat protein